MAFSMFYDGHDLSDILKVLWVDGRGPFQQEIERESISGRHGSIRMNRRIPERALNAECVLLADSFEILREKMGELNNILYTNDAVPIIFSDEPNVTYYGEYAGDPEWEERFVGGRGTLPFVCYDPYKYGEENTTNIDSGVVHIASPVETVPIFEVEFEESASGFEIAHEESGKHLSVEYEFTRGDRLILDATTRKVEINGNTQMPTLTLDSDWFDLLSGDNSFYITDGVANVTLRYRERWL